VEPPVLGILRSTAYRGRVTSTLSAGVRLVDAWNWNPEA
jgi:hypothetical protein